MAARVSIRTRLIVSYITVTVLSLGVLGVLFSGMLSDYLFTEQEKLLLSRDKQWLRSSKTWCRAALNASSSDCPEHE